MAAAFVADTQPAWCARLLAEFTDSDARADALARTLTREQLNWTPVPGAWSIGQCLEHLAVRNEIYVDALEAALTRNLNTGPVPEITPGWFGRWFIRAYIEPSARTKRGTAPKTTRPTARIEPDVLARFLRSNERTRAI